MMKVNWNTPFPLLPPKKQINLYDFFLVVVGKYHPLDSNRNGEQDIKITWLNEIVSSSFFKINFKLFKEKLTKENRIEQTATNLENFIIFFFVEPILIIRWSSWLNWCRLIFNIFSSWQFWKQLLDIIFAYWELIAGAEMMMMFKIKIIYLMKTFPGQIRNQKSKTK